ncbi:hypothetical protein DOK67_0002966 [Enterococcus sp. DIV0212c]
MHQHEYNKRVNKLFTVHDLTFIISYQKATS